MVRSGQIALGRVVMSTWERLLALEPRGKGILAYTLRTDAEVRQADEIFGATKQKGHKVAKVAEPDDTNVVDLMVALRASPGAAPAKTPTKPAPTKAKPAARAAKPAPRRKAS